MWHDVAVWLTFVVIDTNSCLTRAGESSPDRSPAERVCVAGTGRPGSTNPGFNRENVLKRGGRFERQPGEFRMTEAMKRGEHKFTAEERTAKDFWLR
jgi:hypothetical protein